MLYFFDSLCYLAFALHLCHSTLYFSGICCLFYLLIYFVCLFQVWSAEVVSRFASLCPVDFMKYLWILYSHQHNILYQWKDISLSGQLGWSLDVCPFLHQISQSTVPTFNSCIRYVGISGIIHDRKPDCHPVSWAWMHG